MNVRIVDRVLDRLWGFRCILCGGPGRDQDLCVACARDLPWLGNACLGCGLPRPARAVGDRCPSCLAKPPPFAVCLVALGYEYPVDRLITALKYRQQLTYARVLGELLAVFVARKMCAIGVTPPDLIVPVPLNRRRLARRGFNQAAEIGRFVAAALNVKQDLRICERLRDTPPQTGLAAEQRRRNLRGAFGVRTSLKGRRVALLDDVITTGTTVHVITAALRRAGAAQVQVWSVARSLL